MKARIFLVFAAVMAFAGPVRATDGVVLSPLEAWQAEPSTVFDAADVTLEDFQWIARPLVVFADSTADPRFREQMELLADRPEGLIERDVVVIVDTDRANPSDIRRKLRPRGFQITLIGKDGGVKLRKPFPWDVRELSRQIDKMPLRQQEIRSSSQ